VPTLNLAGRRLWRWLPALILLLSAGGGLGLANHGPAPFDEPVLIWFRDSGNSALIAGPAWVTTFWLTVSWLGDALPRIVAAVMALIALLWFRRRRDALLMSGVLLSGLILSSAIKHWVARPRPELVAHLDHFSSASFPSGHALNSTLFYMTIALLLAPLLRRHSERLALYGVAVALSLMIGISRQCGLAVAVVRRRRPLLAEGHPVALRHRPVTLHLAAIETDSSQYQCFGSA